MKKLLLTVAIMAICVLTAKSPVHAQSIKQAVKPYVATEAEKKAAAEKMANGNNGVVKANTPMPTRTEKPFVLSEADKKAAAEKIAKEQSNISERPTVSVMTEAEKRAVAEKIAKEQSKTLANQEVPATTVNTNSPFPIVAKAIDKSNVVNVKATKADSTDASKKLQSDEK